MNKHAADSNPYEPPLKDSVLKAFKTERMMIHSFLIVVFSAVFFGVAGAVIGVALGAFAPAYYRHAFQMARDESTIQMGLGLGMSQGLICGVVVALVVIISTAWYKSRLKSAVIDRIEKRESDANVTNQ